MPEAASRLMFARVSAAALACADQPGCTAPVVAIQAIGSELGRGAEAFSLASSATARTPHRIEKPDVAD
jgi:hypothetical protein